MSHEIRWLINVYSCYKGFNIARETCMVTREVRPEGTTLKFMYRKFSTKSPSQISSPFFLEQEIYYGFPLSFKPPTPL